MKRLIHETRLTGTSFKKTEIEKVKVGDTLSLFRRPDNNYDPEAISVHNGPSIIDPQVGWIPAKTEDDRALKRIFFRLIHAGIGLEAVVTARDGLLIEVDILIKE